MKIKTISAIGATTVLALSMSSNVFAHTGGYVTDGSGNVVRDGSGGCVMSDGGNHFPECEPQVEVKIEKPVFIPKPVAIKPVKPVTVVKKVAPVKPKPVVRPPAPKPPIVKVLSLNETGGSNFGFDRSELSDKARHQLVSFANTVKASGITPSHVTVIGHTDSIGKKSYNQTLSEKRANSVASFLASQGISRNTMSVSGRGETQPVASNKSKAGRAQNRRVDISVSGQKKVIIRR